MVPLRGRGSVAVAVLALVTGDRLQVTCDVWNICLKKKVFAFFVCFDYTGNGVTIRTRREIQCVPHAEFSWISIKYISPMPPPNNSRSRDECANKTRKHSFLVVIPHLPFLDSILKSELIFVCIDFFCCTKSNDNISNLVKKMAKVGNT